MLGESKPKGPKGREAIAKADFLSFRENRRQKWIQLTSAVSHWSHFFLQLPRAKSRVARGRDTQFQLFANVEAMLNSHTHTPTHSHTHTLTHSHTHTHTHTKGV